MTRNIFIPLVLLLIALALIHIFVSKADGLYLNLVSEIFGIIITIFYVDKIIKQYEQSKWVEASELIGKRVRVFLNGLVMGIRVAFKVGMSSSYERLETYDLENLHRITIRIGVDVLKPIAASKVDEMKAPEWRYLAEHCSKTYSSAEDILKTHRWALTADQIASILRIQDRLADAMFGYNMMPEIAEMDHQAHHRNSGTIEKAIIDMTATNLGQVLEEAEHLSGLFP